ncbi:hypothetical protein QBC36DRAFT_309675 [Triangularia setosa]|uniref:Uncharacterized protein n=1 Tax=Triangularia setosa TaxID=2587417 RepID=A0AAN6W9M2_9PEZI|nr:hypothetical protein QBC36DRAFT_309675 [Podospora setosa]
MVERFGVSVVSVRLAQMRRLRALFNVAASNETLSVAVRLRLCNRGWCEGCCTGRSAKQAEPEEEEEEFVHVKMLFLVRDTTQQQEAWRKQAASKAMRNKVRAERCVAYRKDLHLLPLTRPELVLCWKYTSHPRLFLATSQPNGRLSLDRRPGSRILCILCWLPVVQNTPEPDASLQRRPKPHSSGGEPSSFRSSHVVTQRKSVLAVTNDKMDND